MNIKFNHLLYIVIAILLIFVTIQCNRTNSLKGKLAASNQNRIALTDSINTYKSKNGKLISEKASLIATRKQLKDLNKNLLKEIEDIKGNVKTIVKTEIEYVDTSRPIPITVHALDSTYKLGWEFLKNKENFNQELKGYIIVNTNNDTLHVVESTLVKNKLNLQVISGITERNDTLFAFVNPPEGFNVNAINSNQIPLKKLRGSNIVMGPQVGLTFNPNSIYYVQPYIGFGLTYKIRIKKINIFGK